MKLTKKKALEIVIELWTWIVDNPSNYKHRWPGWEKYGDMKSNCPFCEYDRTHRLEEKCDCPLDHPPRLRGCLQMAYGKWSPYHEDGGHAAAVEFLAQLKEIKGG